jgi:starvation-inducible DNA-binding protein
VATATVAKNTVALSAARKKEIAADLNTSLAHLIDLALRAKEAHWNVTGPNFHGLHETFDAIATDVRDYADDIAERARALGHLAHGTLNNVTKKSTLGDFPADSADWKTLVQLVHDGLVTTSQVIQGFAAQTEDDIATQDVYIEVIRGLDKWAWMLASHLS